ncbi:MAG: hypothetical protein ACRYG8_47430 [Janthinobacterium lividum]
MTPAQLNSTFPGVLYAGDGARLAGVGPSTFTPEMDASLPFKVLIHACPPTADDDALALEDRLWVLPEQFSTPDALPTPLLNELANLVHAGGKIGLASADEQVCNQARDILLLLLAEPEGRA